MKYTMKMQILSDRISNVCVNNLVHKLFYKSNHKLHIRLRAELFNQIKRKTYNFQIISELNSIKWIFVL